MPKDEHNKWADSIPGAKPAKPWKQVSSAAQMQKDLQDDLDGEEPLPPVSMHLPEPGEKPAPAARPKAPAKPKVVTFDPKEEKKEKNFGVIKGDARAFKNEVVNAMRHLSDRALIRADEYTIEVLGACLDFQKYARPKIEEIKKARESAGELAGALVNGVLGVAGGMLAAKVAAKLGEKIGEELAKQIADKVADGLKESLVNRVKTMNESSDLEEAVETVAQGFRFYASAVHKTVEDKLGQYASAMEEKANAGKISNAELAVLTSLMNLNDAALDNVLEQKFGIPGPGRSKEIHVAIYQEMVKRFERIHLRAESAIKHDDKGMNDAFIDAIGVAEREAGKLSEQMRRQERR